MKFYFKSLKKSPTSQSRICLLYTSGGHGNYIVIGGNDVSDVRHAIELGLELTKKNAGELYISESGHLEFTYSASAGAALQKACLLYTSRCV